MSGTPRAFGSEFPGRVLTPALTAIAAITGALSGLHPLEIAVVDPLLVAVTFAAVVWFTGRLRRGVLTVAAVAAALAVPLSWATLCLVAVVVLDLVRWPPVRASANGRMVSQQLAAVLLLAACTGLVDREFVHQSAVASGLAIGIVLIAGVVTLPRRPRTIVVSVAALAIVVGGAASLAFAWRALDSRSLVSDAIDAVNSGLDAARDGDADTARTQLDIASHNVAEARAAVDTWWLSPTRLVPVVAPNARVTVDTLSTVDDALAELSTSVEGIGFDALSFDDGRVDLAEVDRVNVRLAAANDTVAELATITDERSVWLVDDLTRRLDQLESRLVEIAPTLDDATAALDVLPAILGGEGERHYLLVFVTPSEARGGGGFAGNWAEVTATDGRIELVEQGRAGELNPPADQLWSIDGQDEYLGRYDNFRVRSLWQNVTMSPDFPTVADVMSQIYPQATGREIDGVIRLGPPAMEALLRITGPVAVEGRDEPLSADQAVEFLTRDQYGDAFAEEQDRVDYLGNTVEAVFDMLTTQGVGNPVTAARALQPAIDSGDLVMWLHERAETDLVQRLDMTGALPPAFGNGDAFTVTQHDLLPNKIDAWSRRFITYEVQLNAETGELQGFLSVEMFNSAPSDGTDLQVGGQTDQLPRGTMRELLTIYTPHRIDLLTVDGEQVVPSVQSELGYFTYTTEVIVPPGGSTVVEGIIYGTDVLDEGAYRLTVAANPAVQRDTLKVTLNGRRVFKGTMDEPYVIACRPSPDRCS